MHDEDRILDPETVRHRWRELRRRTGWSYAEVARRIGSHPSSPAKWEGGDRPIPERWLVRFAEAAGVAPDFFIRPDIRRADTERAGQIEAARILREIANRLEDGRGVWDDRRNCT